MEDIIQSQKNWNDFQTNGKVGVITTLFSEQFLSETYEIIPLSYENYREDIELNDVDTVFIDNDLFETDHVWYRKNRGHIVNYLKNNNKNICVIKNTSLDVAQTFKKAFVLEIEPEGIGYKYLGLLLKMPLTLNTKTYNPINTVKNIDITHFYIGKSTTTLDNKNYNLDFIPNVKINSVLKLNRVYLEELIKTLKTTKILYINKNNAVDIVTLRYIEYIAYLNSTYVIYDHKFEYNSLFESDSTDFKLNNNMMTVLLRNPEYSFKKTLARQRHILINHSIVMKANLKEFLKGEKLERNIPKISVITSTNRRENLEFYLEQMNYQRYVSLEINLVTHGFELSETEKDSLKKSCKFDVNILHAERFENLGACLNKCIELCTHQVVAKIDDDDYYLENYMIDQWLALEYSQADVVGKSESYYYFEADDLIGLRKKGEHSKYSNFIMGATIMAKSDIIKELLFADIPRAVDTNFLRRVVENEGTIYIGNPYEMCVFRSANTDDHTWQVNNLAMLKSADIVGYGNPVPYVSVK
ncbi:hypothetical protein [Salinicoccus sp. Marseille-QA3877]